MILYFIRNTIIFFIFIYSCHYIYSYSLDVMTVPIVKDFSMNKNNNRENIKEEEGVTNIDSLPQMKDELTDFLSQLK